MPHANQFFVQTVGALAQSIISGPMRTVPDGLNAVYSGAAGTFQTQTFNSSSYYVDLQTVVEGTPAPPTVTTTPAANATLVPVDAQIKGRFSRPIDARKLNASTFLVTK